MGTPLSVPKFTMRSYHIERSCSFISLNYSSVIRYILPRVFVLSFLLGSRKATHPPSQLSELFPKYNL